MNTPLDSLNQTLWGGGEIETAGEQARRLTIPASRRGYADAQLDDYRGLPRRRFPWTPPARLRLRARASHPRPLGTLGFGFWNDPLTLSLGQAGAARRLPASPRAVWFFYGSSPNDLSFTPGLPGHGWRAASLEAARVPGPLLAPGAAAAFLLSRLPGLRRPVLRAARLAVRGTEAMVDDPLDAWHDYDLEWHGCEAIFRVDGDVLLVAEEPPPGPLGFVLWIDNQYAAASPEAGFRFGVLPTHEPQWLEVTDFHLEAL